MSKINIKATTGLFQSRVYEFHLILHQKIDNCIHLDKDFQLKRDCLDLLSIIDSPRAIKPVWYVVESSWLASKSTLFSTSITII